MKRILFSLACLFAVFQMVAQPSGGVYTLADLATLLPNAIQVTSPNHYRIMQNVTLEPQDTLLLQTTDEYVLVDNGKEITILGSLQTQERTTPLLIQNQFCRRRWLRRSRTR